jgi:hypothetical protein
VDIERDNKLSGNYKYKGVKQRIRHCDINQSNVSLAKILNNPF